MLNVDALQSDLQQTFEETFYDAFYEGFKATMGQESESLNESAANFAETLTDLLSEPLAERIAGAIHMYVSNISIVGTIITNGSPTTQTAVCTSGATPSNGIVPNQLGVK